MTEKDALQQLIDECLVLLRSPDKRVRETASRDLAVFFKRMRGLE